MENTEFKNCFLEKKINTFWEMSLSIITIFKK